MTHHTVEWLDSGREPVCSPDPRYPEGIDVPRLDGEQNHCKVLLPYPAKRCGLYIVTCSLCDSVIGLTTAGRPDDPRSVEMPCYVGKLATAPPEGWQ